MSQGHSILVGRGGGGVSSVKQSGQTNIMLRRESSNFIVALAERFGFLDVFVEISVEVFTLETFISFVDPSNDVFLLLK